MVCVETITAYNFPKQSEYVNRRCDVCFHYDTSVSIPGTVIRDDSEEPFETLIQLDDGRVLRAAECQYSHYRPRKRGEIKMFNVIKLRDILQFPLNCEPAEPIQIVMPDDDWTDFAEVRSDSELLTAFLDYEIDCLGGEKSVDPDRDEPILRMSIRAPGECEASQ